MRIRIDKARRRLSLWQGRKCLYHCPVQLGRCPVGPKSREGDGRMPEGAYRICSRNPQSRFFRALGLSYPGEIDARAAFRAGQIDQGTLHAIEAAARRRARPPWDTPLGGWIMIHGQPSDGRPVAGDWTAGCIALSDQDAEKLYELVPLGTRVAIGK